MRTFLRVLAIACLASGSIPIAAAPPSTCPPVMGERQSMLGVINSVGLNNQTARLCGVTELAIQHKTAVTMSRLSPCLSERRIGASDIDAELQRGAVAGQQAYERSANKPLICESMRDQFAED